MRDVGYLKARELPVRLDCPERELQGLYLLPQGPEIPYLCLRVGAGLPELGDLIGKDVPPVLHCLDRLDHVPPLFVESDQPIEVERGTACLQAFLDCIRFLSYESGIEHLFLQ